MNIALELTLVLDVQHRWQMGEVRWCFLFVSGQPYLACDEDMR